MSRLFRADGKRGVRTWLANLRQNGRRENVLALTLMALPFLVLVFIYSYIPMYGATIAFKDYNYRDGILNSPWCVPLLKNFKFLFASPDTAKMFRTTLFYSMIQLFLGPVVSIIVALLLNEVRNRRAAKAYQTFMLWPSYLSAIVLAYIAYTCLNPRMGYLNHIIKFFGGTSINVYNMPGPWKIIIPIIGIWAGAGSGSLLYYSTLLNVDPTYYEAAVLDGATRWQMMINISLPSLIPIWCIGMILGIGGALSSNFGLMYNLPMNSPMVVRELKTLDVYIYNSLMTAGSSGANLGMSSAAGFFKSAVGCILVVTTNLIVKKVDPDRSLF